VKSAGREWKTSSGRRETPECRRADERMSEKRKGERRRGREQRAIRPGRGKAAAAAMLRLERKIQQYLQRSRQRKSSGRSEERE
jgi:hypothetical protein